MTMIVTSGALPAPTTSGPLRSSPFRVPILGALVFTGFFLMFSEMANPGYGIVSTLIESPQRIEAARELDRARVVFNSVALKFESGYICPRAELWETTSGGSRSQWHAHWQAHNLKPFYFSDACYSHAGLAAGSMLATVEKNAEFAKLVVAYTQINCPNPERWASMSGADHKRWHTYASMQGPVIAGNPLCYDP